MTEKERLAEARARTAEHMRPIALRLMRQEVRPWTKEVQKLDPRDAVVLIDGLRRELKHCKTMGMYPVHVYEEYSPHVEKPRTAHLAAALMFLNLEIGRPALIDDVQERNGYVARILVY